MNIVSMIRPRIRLHEAMRRSSAMCANRGIKYLVVLNCAMEKNSRTSVQTYKEVTEFYRSMVPRTTSLGPFK